MAERDTRFGGNLETANMRQPIPLSRGRSSGNRTVRRNMYDRSAYINRQRDNIGNPVVKNNPPSMINSRPETKALNMLKNFAPTGGKVGRHIGNFLVDNFQPDQSARSSDRNNSGLMLAMANSPAVNKMKNIYNQVDPFFPDVDPIDQQIGYDFNKNLWGGNLGFGGGYDMEDDAYNAYINWGTNW